MEEIKYSARLVGREMYAGEIMVLHFEKPEGYVFRAGQFCFLSVPDIGFMDERGLRRHFSIASSPLEQELIFAMKMSGSAIKKTLREMPPGTTATIEPPLGSLCLPEDTSSPLVFLAAGIGITPFRSMLRYAAEARTGHAVTLFYSSRTPDEAVFLGELQDTAGMRKDISVVATMTRVPESSETWSGLRGRISPSMIIDHCSSWKDAVYYIAGPPKMVDGMMEMLKEMNIRSGLIKPERFTGY